MRFAALTKIVTARTAEKQRESVNLPPSPPVGIPILGTSVD